MHPQLRPFTRQLFLDFCAIFSPEWPLIFFVVMIHQVIWPSPGTLTEAPQTRVPGLPIRDCARGCNNCVHTRAQMSAIDVTKKILFERLYLVPGMRTFAPWVNCPYAQLRLFTPQLFLDFCAIFFPEWPLNFWVIPIHQVISRYPPPNPVFYQNICNCLHLYQKEDHSKIWEIYATLPGAPQISSYVPILKLLFEICDRADLRFRAIHVVKLKS